jgi:hypothetical protein
MKLVTLKLVPGDLDAQLIASCEKHIELGARLDKLIVLPTGADVGHQGILKVLSEMEAVETEIMAIRAETLRGFQAKAEIARWARQGNLNADNDACLAQRIAWSVVRDLCHHAI